MIDVNYKWLVKMIHAKFLNVLLSAMIGWSLLSSDASRPAAAQSESDTQTVYKYFDEKGVLHLTNVPPSAQNNVIYSRSYLIQFYTPPDPVEQSPLPTFATPPAAPAKKVRYAQEILTAARLTQVPIALLQAVIQIESAYNPKALSPKGAQGLMQLMPGTAKRYGVKDSYDPASNIQGGAQYLRDLLDLFKGDVSLALAAYNAGEGAVLKYGKKIPPYRETQAYVKKVLAAYQTFANP